MLLLLLVFDVVDESSNNKSNRLRKQTVNIVILEEMFENENFKRKYKTNWLLLIA